MGKEPDPAPVYLVGQGICHEVQTNDQLDMLIEAVACLKPDGTLQAAFGLCSPGCLVVLDQ